MPLLWCRAFFKLLRFLWEIVHKSPFEGVPWNTLLSKSLFARNFHKNRTENVTNTNKVIVTGGYGLSSTKILALINYDKWMNTLWENQIFQLKKQIHHITFSKGVFNSKTFSSTIFLCLAWKEYWSMIIIKWFYWR